MSNFYAVYRNFFILIFDEPTAALNPIAEFEIDKITKDKTDILFLTDFLIFNFPIKFLRIEAYKLLFL